MSKVVQVLGKDWYKHTRSSKHALGWPEAMNATASIPIASGSLYLGMGWKRGGGRKACLHTPKWRLPRFGIGCGNQE
jgi:hypothetical protein